MARAEGIIRMYESLNKAMDSAGGSPLSLERLSKMSAMDLIDQLGPNSITFQHKQTKTTFVELRWGNDGKDIEEIISRLTRVENDIPYLTDQDIIIELNEITTMVTKLKGE